MKRDVSSRIVLDVTEPADLIFAVAVSDQYYRGRENFTATLDEEAVAYRVVPDAHGTRLHRLSSGVGRLEVTTPRASSVRHRPPQRARPT